MLTKKEKLHLYWFARMMWYLAVQVERDAAVIEKRRANAIKWRTIWQSE